MSKLRCKYAREPDYGTPRVVFWDRSSVVNIESLVIDAEANTDEMIERVNTWLRTEAGLPFHYQLEFR
jgi:hypothetical protein